MVNLVARSLRKSMTPQEIKLWVQLRYFNDRGFHFRRQVPFGPYVVDFAEKSARLVIEVDGSQHSLPDGVLKDERRDRYMAGLGYHTLRFWNFDIDTGMDGVIDAVTAVLDRRP